MDERIRILIADDHNLLRSGITTLLENEKNIFVVGEAETGKELINKYFDLKPDVVLADISMPGINGIEALKEIKKKDPAVKFLFLSMHEGDEYLYYCYKAGGMGLISKKILKGELLYSITMVYEGKKYFGVNTSEEKIKEIISKYDKKNNSHNISIETLTAREAQMLTLIGEGLTSNEIAEKLFLGKRTVDSHRTNLMQKLNLRSLPALIKYAINFNIGNESNN